MIMRIKPACIVLLALALGTGVALGSALARTGAKAAQVGVRLLAAVLVACGVLWVLPATATPWTDLAMGTAAAGLGAWSLRSRPPMPAIIVTAIAVVLTGHLPGFGALLGGAVGIGAAVALVAARTRKRPPNPLVNRPAGLLAVAVGVLVVARGAGALSGWTP